MNNSGHEQQDKAAAEGIRDAELPLHRLAQSIGPESSPRLWEGRLNTQWEDYAEEIAANFRRAMNTCN